MNLVSVVIPTCNCGAYLAEAVRSVLDQNYQHVEVLVVDDGSTDNTPEVLRSLGGRVRCFREQRGGPSVARNRALLNARGDYVAFLDADDLWLPPKLERQVEVLDRHPEVVLCYTDFSRGPDPRQPGPSELRGYRHMASGRVFYHLLQENFLHTSTVVVRREALSRSGLFDPSLRGSEDIELWLRLARVGEVAGVDEVLARIRLHQRNTHRTLEFNRQQVLATQAMLARWGHDAEAARLLRRRLGACCFNLAHAEQVRGHYARARSAYWASARWGHRRARSLLQAARMALARPPAPFQDRQAPPEPPPAAVNAAPPEVATR